MVYTKHVTFVLFFISNFLLQAQKCDLQLKGTIRDEDNSESLSFAVVKLISPEIVVQTNDKGEFEFKDLCPGPYQILIKHAGCRDSVFHLELRKSKK